MSFLLFVLSTVLDTHSFFALSCQLHLYLSFLFHDLPTALYMSCFSSKIYVGLSPSLPLPPFSFPLSLSPFYPSLPLPSLYLPLSLPSLCFSLSLSCLSVCVCHHMRKRNIPILKFVCYILLPEINQQYFLMEFHIVIVYNDIERKNAHKITHKQNIIPDTFEKIGLKSYGTITNVELVQRTKQMPRGGRIAG